MLLFVDCESENCIFLSHPHNGDDDNNNDNEDDDDKDDIAAAVAYNNDDDGLRLFLFSFFLLRVLFLLM